jgi:hypothetical protein
MCGKGCPAKPTYKHSERALLFDEKGRPSLLIKALRYGDV